MTDPTLSGGMEPLLEALASALRRTYPSKGAIDWADRLASKYGESRVITALGRASQEAEPHRVLTVTEELLEYESALQERQARQQKEVEHQEAKRQRAESRRLPVQTDPRPLSEIMPDVAEAFGKKRGNPE